jgi:hypothetical protein
MYSKERDLLFVVSDAARLLQPILEKNLQDAAAASDWPENIVKSLTVSFDGSNLLVNYPDELAAEIDDLEYGKPYGLPQPVIRPFIYDSESYVTEVLVGRALDLILDAEGVI